MTILHYTEKHGSKEYIVLSDDDLTPKDIKDYTIPGYVLNNKYEAILDKIDTLPTDRILIPNYFPC